MIRDDEIRVETVGRHTTDGYVIVDNQKPRIRVTHIETGISVECGDYLSAGLNLTAAKKELEKLLESA